PKRSENRKALVGLIEPILRTATRAEWIERFEAAGVPVAPLHDIPELVASEQMAAMDMARTLPGRGLEVIGLPFSIDKERPRPTRGAPKLGEHNDEVFGTFEAAADGDDWLDGGRRVNDSSAEASSPRSDRGNRGKPAGGQKAA